MTMRFFCDRGSNADGFSRVRTGSPFASSPAVLTIDGSPGSFAIACRSEASDAATAEAMRTDSIREVYAFFRGFVLSWPKAPEAQLMLDAYRRPPGIRRRRAAGRPRSRIHQETHSGRLRGR